MKLCSSGSVVFFVLMLGMHPLGAQSRARAGTQPCPSLTKEAPDSIRGTVTVVGPQPLSWVAVTTATDEQIVLYGKRDVLEQFQGAEIVVFGKMLRGQGHTSGADTVMAVARTIVRTMDGESAYDGILRRETIGNVLETCGGKRLKLGPLPPNSPPNGERIAISNLEFPNAVLHLKPGTP